MKSERAGVQPNSTGSPQSNVAHTPKLLVSVVLLANVLLVITLVWGILFDVGRSKSPSLNEIADRLAALEDAIDSVRLGKFHDSIDRVVAGAADDQERCKRVAAHIAYYMGNDYFGFDQPGPDDELSWWESRRGLCGARAHLMVMALQRLNIRAKIWNIYDYGFAHSAVQAFYDGEWHYFDPSYAGCFVDDDGVVMSWNQIIADPEAAMRGLVVFETPMDTYSDGSRVKAENRMRFTYDQEKLADVQAAGVPWSRTFQLPVRLRMPIGDVQIVKYGEINGDPDDLRIVLSDRTSESLSHQDDAQSQIVYLGREAVEATECYYLDALGMYHDNFTHQLTLTDVEADTRYQVTWHFLDERAGPGRLVASTSTGQIVEGAVGPVCADAEQWSFIYDPGEGDEHRIDVGLSSTDSRSYVRVGAVIVERITAN